MKLSELTDLLQRTDLGDPGHPRRPPRKNLDEVAKMLARALEDPEFRLDCIHHDLEAWRRWDEDYGWDGMKPALLRLPERGYFVTLFYWPPGEVSPPHEHTSWTVSSMFSGTLEVETYHWNIAVEERRLARRSLFTAKPGPVGYIYDNAIHSPRNVTDRGAISFHIYNADDGPILEMQVGPIEGLESYDRSSTEARPPSLFVRVRQEVLRAHAESVQRYPCEQSMAMFERLYRLGDAATREVVAGMMNAVDGSAAPTALARLRAELHDASTPRL